MCFIVSILSIDPTNSWKITFFSGENALNCIFVYKLKSLIRVLIGIYYSNYSNKVGELSVTI